MDKKRATEILDNCIRQGGDELYNCGWYLSWSVGSDDATLDGQFSAEELEVIAWWMRNNGGI